MAINGRFLADHPERIEEILQRLADGETLTGICKEMGCTPGAVSHYVESHGDELFQRYARAREMQANSLAEDVVRIADEEEDPAKARVRVDARKWLASKVNPAKFGDKVTVGGDPDAPITTISRIELVPVSPKPRDE